MEIELKNMNKSFGDQIIFQDFNLHIQDHESIAVLGDSGKGKSTLLNILGLFEKVNSGEILIDGVNIEDKSFDQIGYLRYKVGYLFQNYALVDTLTVDKNLNIALEYVDASKKEKEEMKDDALEKVKLQWKQKVKVYSLSGGEQQRLAIARLLIKPCEIILADEPTGALDENNKQNIIGLLNILKTMNKTLVIVSHDRDVTQLCDRVIEL